jgi:hypothetical protein
MNQLSTAKRVQVIAALVEGNSIRSTERMADDRCREEYDSASAR